MSKAIENEAMFINAYVKEFYPTATALGKTRVGKRPYGSEIYSVTLGYPDKILLLPGEVIIIEGKIKPTTAAVGQLEFYGQQFLETPGFDVYRDFKKRLILLTPIDDPVVRAYAESKGIEYIVYKPKEVNRLLEERLHLGD